jgi:hypothetical protein
MLADQVIARHGNIAEGGMQGGMTEQLLQGEGVPARSEVSNREAMAELVSGKV